MQTQRLGRTGLEITRIGFGAWAIGGGEYAFGWGSQDDRDSVAAIERAVAEGVNWIDAPHSAQSRRPFWTADSSVTA